MLAAAVDEAAETKSPAKRISVTLKYRMEDLLQVHCSLWCEVRAVAPGHQPRRLPNHRDLVH